MKLFLGVVGNILMEPIANFFLCEVNDLIQCRLCSAYLIQLIYLINLCERLWDIYKMCGMSNLPLVFESPLLKTSFSTLFDAL
jgi:hypothetical protein